jgi:ubiquinone biosynthesis monooxygenase Coq7
MKTLANHQTLDRWIAGFDRALRTVGGVANARRPRPKADSSAPLTPESARLSAALMRVNHVGEVCAQALYAAQALTSRDPSLQAELAQAAEEEEDHLAWCAERLQELDGRVSLLNPLWWSGAFGIGLLAGLAGDRWSLGFVVETERQVEAHLASHLDRLPADDHASRAIVDQMKADEAAHADWAQARGAAPLPEPVRVAMRAAANVMTRTAHHV